MRDSKRLKVVDRTCSRVSVPLRQRQMEDKHGRHVAGEDVTNQGCDRLDVSKCDAADERDRSDPRSIYQMRFTCVSQGVIWYGVKSQGTVVSGVGGVGLNPDIHDPQQHTGRHTHQHCNQSSGFQSQSGLLVNSASYPQSPQQNISHNQHGSNWGHLVRGSNPSQNSFIYSVFLDLPRLLSYQEVNLSLH